MSGLFPANPAQAATEEDDSIMRVLLRRVELPEELMLSLEAQAKNEGTGRE